MLAVFCLYLVLSPKSPLRSAARVLWPWSSVEAPTRVTIHDVQPGDATVFHGDSLTVSAEVAGLRRDEPVLLLYSTADGQLIDQGIQMTPAEGGYRYQCQLPPGKIGLQQDCQYRLAAGDCRTRTYHVEVQIAPAIVVDSVSYHYPAYTGLADRTVFTQGDLQAIEGTAVTIHATANTEIKPGTAEIDLGCTGRPGVQMPVDGRAATGQFTLRLDPNDPSRGEYDCYQLRFSDPKGRENERPIRHRIDVIRDLPPEVRVVEPQQEEVNVAASGGLDIKVRADDPDFALRRVTLQAECGGRALPIRPLLDKRKPAAGWQGEFSATYDFRPARLGLKDGDRVTYWVAADDNKEPTAGHTASRKQRITIGNPKSGPSKSADGAKGDRRDPGKQNSAQASGRNQSDDQSGLGQEQQTSDSGHKNQSRQTASQGQNRSDKPQPSAEQPKGEKTGGSPDNSAQGTESGKTANGQQQGEKSAASDKGQADSSTEKNDRVDPDTDPGDAMEKILKDRQKQQQEQKQGGSNQSQDNGEKSGNQQPGSAKSGQGQSGQDNSNAEKSNAQESNAEQSGGEKPGTEKSVQTGRTRKRLLGTSRAPDPEAPPRLSRRNPTKASPAAKSNVVRRARRSPRLRRRATKRPVVKKAGRSRPVT